jgi:hypothetical protein
MAGRVVVTVLIILAAGCRSGHNAGKDARKPAPSVGDMTITIDGREAKGWEITNFGPQGPVYVSGDQIILGMGDGCTGITWKSSFPVSDYEVSLWARRVEGNDFFCGLTFPVGKDPCTLIVGGWGGTTVGLSNIDGHDASDNQTRKLMQFENGRWYHVRLLVSEKNITAWIDTSKVVDLDITGRRLSVRPEVELSRPFGITSWNTTAAIRDIEISTAGMK